MSTVKAGTQKSPDPNAEVSSGPDHQPSLQCGYTDSMASPRFIYLGVIHFYYSC